MPFRHRLMLGGAVVVALLAAGFTYAVRDARARILQALGPRATVGSISFSYPAVTLRDVRIGADTSPGAWPAPEEFHAGLVEVRIEVGSLWAFRHGRPLRIVDVHVADGTLVMLRTKGHLTTLPALRETSEAKSGAMHARPPASATDDSTAASTSEAPEDPAAIAQTHATAMLVAHARVDRMAVDLYDTTLPGGGMHRLRFEQVHGHVDDVALPTLDRAIAVDMTGLVKGGERDGTMTIQGTLSPASHDAALAIRLASGDMVTLAPWLHKFDPQPVKHGRIDLTLDARVKNRTLHAPGQLTLTGLEFGEPGGSFAGLERRALLAALERDGRIDLKFTLDGPSDDPTFSLDEKIGRRVAAGLGKAAGVSVEGAVEGVGGVIKGLLGGAHAASQARP